VCLLYSTRLILKVNKSLLRFSISFNCYKYFSIVSLPTDSVIVDHVYNNIQDLSELADQNNTVKSSSSGNNRKNIFLNPSSLDFKIRTFLIDQSLVDIKLPNYLKK
jgi:hypothetical protein